MPQLGFGVNFVEVAAATFVTGDISRLNEIGDYVVSRSFCDATLGCYLTNAYVLVMRYQEQHGCMVGEEGPRLVGAGIRHMTNSISKLNIVLTDR